MMREVHPRRGYRRPDGRGVIRRRGAVADRRSPAAADRHQLRPPPPSPRCLRQGESAGRWRASSASGTARWPRVPVGAASSVSPAVPSAARAAWCPTPRSRTRDSRAVAAIADALLNPAHPRDGVTVVGGKPFAQPEALVALLVELRRREPGLHLTAYSGYTLEALDRRREPAVRAALDLLDLLIDGPFVRRLHRGSRGSGGARPTSASSRIRAAPWRPVAQSRTCRRAPGWRAARRPVPSDPPTPKTGSRRALRRPAPRCTPVFPRADRSAMEECPPQIPATSRAPGVRRPRLTTRVSSTSAGVATRRRSSRTRSTRSADRAGPAGDVRLIALAE